MSRFIYHGGIKQLKKKKKSQKHKERQVRVFIKKGQVTWIITACCTSVFLTKYLSGWSELIEEKCSSITKSSSFLKRALTWCYTGQEERRKLQRKNFECPPEELHLFALRQDFQRSNSKPWLGNTENNSSCFPIRIVHEKRPLTVHE